MANELDIKAVKAAMWDVLSCTYAENDCDCSYADGSGGYSNILEDVIDNQIDLIKKLEDE